jgi:hypothetical protein
MFGLLMGRIFFSKPINNADFYFIRLIRMEEFEGGIIERHKRNACASKGEKPKMKRNRKEHYLFVCCYSYDEWKAKRRFALTRCFCFAE